MKTNWRNACVSPNATITDVIGVIDRGGAQIALVVDENGKLCGTITDGDVRRCLMQGVSLDVPVTRFMNAQPSTALETATLSEIRAMMVRHSHHQIPVIDDQGRVVRLEIIDSLLQSESKPNKVVLMAGGLGLRLRPLTAHRPKPLLEVGGRPILETTINRLVAQGYTDICLSLGYKAEMIQAHFGDGEEFGAKIHYLLEEEPLGTAGALSLIQEAVDEPFLVMNSDILTTLKVDNLIAFHKEKGGVATMGVRSHDTVVPFGVVEATDDRLVCMREKPVIRHLVNTGIYVLEPTVLEKVASGRYMDMPDLLAKVNAEKEGSVSVYPVFEYWIDVGRSGDFQRAERDYRDVFHE